MAAVAVLLLKSNLPNTDIHVSVVKLTMHINRVVAVADSLIRAALARRIFMHLAFSLAITAVIAVLIRTAVASSTATSFTTHHGTSTDRK